MVVVMALFIGSSCRINTLVVLCFRPAWPSHWPKYAYTSRMCSFIHWIEDVCKINITVRCCTSIRPVGAHWLQVKLRDGETTTSTRPCHYCVLFCLCCIEYFYLTPLQFSLAEYSMFGLQEYLS